MFKGEMTRNEIENTPYPHLMLMRKTPLKYEEAVQKAQQEAMRRQQQ